MCSNMFFQLCFSNIPCNHSLDQLFMQDLHFSVGFGGFRSDGDTSVIHFWTAIFHEIIHPAVAMGSPYDYGKPHLCCPTIGLSEE